MEVGREWSPPVRRVDGEIVFERGTPAHRVYFLASGAVEVFQRGSEGVAIVVKILAPPNIFGVIEAVHGERHYLESVRVLGNATLLSADRDTFNTILRTQPAFCMAVLQNTAAAFCSAARFESTHLAPTESRLANLLLAYTDLFGEHASDGIELPLRRNQTEFAEAIASSERHVNRVLAEWKEQEIVTKRDARYVIRDRDRLAAVAEALQGSLVLPAWTVDGVAVHLGKRRN